MAGCGPAMGTLKGPDGTAGGCAAGCPLPESDAEAVPGEDAVRTRKVVRERYDPAPGRVAPDAGGRKRRCKRFVLEADRLTEGAI